MKRKKISIWILHGSSGVTFELTMLKLTALICTIGVCIGAALFAVRKSVSDARVTAAASTSILEQYLTQRMSAKEAQEAVKQADIVAPKIRSEDNERVVDAKIRLLAEEFVRVRSYEKQLQSRASVLDSVLDSILDLDDSFIDRGETRADEELEGDFPEAAHLGIGGGDTPVSTLFSQYSMRKRQRREPEAAARTTIEHFDSHIDRLNSVPLGTPVVGIRTSGFGARYSPFTGKYHQHSGLDIAVDRETAVVATGDGKVIHAGAKGAYGELVIIDHGNNVRTLYAHLSRTLIKKGQRVCRGQQIGLVGSSGRSTGPHLHYEVRHKGVPRNPEPFVQLAGLLRSFGIK